MNGGGLSTLKSAQQPFHPGEATKHWKGWTGEQRTALRPLNIVCKSNHFALKKAWMQSFI